MALTGQNHGSFGSKVWELRFAFATPEFRKLGFALRDNRQQTTNNGHTTATRSLVVLQTRSLRSDSEVTQSSWFVAHSTSVCEAIAEHKIR